MAARDIRGEDARDTRQTTDAPAVWRRLAWFAGLWLAGVATLFVIASVIRWAIL
jgi:fatty acid desaturase